MSPTVDRFISTVMVDMNRFLQARLVRIKIVVWAYLEELRSAGEPPKNA
jgi:hypothetical protein